MCIRDSNNAVKAGEPSQTFTMSITNHDDAVGKVTFDFDGEVQYADKMCIRDSSGDSCG